MKLATVLGVRPELVQAAAVSRALAACAHVDEVVIHTGQHYDAALSTDIMHELDMPAPRHRLAIGSGSHGAQTGRMLAAIESVLLAERPDCVLVYCDTNTTLAGALAAAKLAIPIVHVEAGLRGRNRRLPEELNRVLVDRLSSVHLCPNGDGRQNLIDEGQGEHAEVVGDLIFDALELIARSGERHLDPLARLRLAPGGYALATVHRAENTASAAALARVLAYLEEQARQRPVLWPLHPRTRAALRRFGLAPRAPHALRECAPFGYRDMARLLAGAACIYTDSGGLQREAYAHRVPCVTLRTETEWPQTIAAGWNRLWSQPHWQPRRPIDGFGEPGAAARVVAVLRRLAASG